MMCYYLNVHFQGQRVKKEDGNAKSTHFMSDPTCLYNATFISSVAQSTCVLLKTCYFFFQRRCGPKRAMASFLMRFLDHTQRRTTVGRTPLDEWSARRRHLYLTTHNSHIHAPGGIRTHNLSRREAANLRLRTRGHWDRLRLTVTTPQCSKTFSMWHEMTL